MTNSRVEHILLYALGRESTLPTQLSRVEELLVELIQGGLSGGGDGSGSGGTIRVDSELSTSSINPVQNKVISSKLYSIENTVQETNDFVISQFESVEEELKKTKESIEERFTSLEEKIDQGSSSEPGSQPTDSELLKKIEQLESQMSSLSSDYSNITNQLTSLETTIKSINTEIDTKISQVTGDIDMKIAIAIAKVVSNAPVAYDTLGEIADWIAKHTNEFTEVRDQTKKNTEAIENMDEGGLSNSYVDGETLIV